jgi:asparagine synthase (glutamine-hydrolysing)
VHQRLSIIDLSPTGRQPMSGANRRVHIVFNGEIYNYRELRAQLQAGGTRFTGESDTEVLLNLYIRDGEPMLRRLSGIFAFGIFDERSQSLFLARDQLGVKPLYYSEGLNGFSFASEMKALLRTGLVAPLLDPAVILRHLGLLWSPGADTIVRGIRKLEPGCAMTVRDGRVARIWNYYDLPVDLPMLTLHPDDMAREVATAVRAAVKRQMVADVPVGAFLSGGLDSSSVVAFARTVSAKENLQCFTIDVRNGNSEQEGFTNDLPYARQVAKHLDVDLHVVTVGPEMMDRLPEMLYYLDEPTADPAALNALFIAELAHAHGFKVLLSGAGGDDIFSGYRRHVAIRHEMFWAWLPKLPRSWLSTLVTQFPSTNPWLRRIRKAFEYAALPQDSRIASYFAWLPPADTLSLLNHEFANSLQPAALLSPLLHSLGRLPDGVDPLNALLYLECKHFLADHNLNYTDKMGMATGVEVRVPLIDVELVRLAYQIPPHFKQRGTTGKWIFKKAMEPYLPRSAIYRPKSGFGVPLRQWLHTRLGEVLQEVLAPASLEQRGIFDPVAVHTLLKRDRARQVDATYTIFAMLCLELWCRQYVDGNYSVMHH